MKKTVNLQSSKSKPYCKKQARRIEGDKKTITISPLMPRGYSAVQRRKLREYERQILLHNK